MRLATEEDTRAIRDALWELHSYAKQYNWALEVDFDAGSSAVADCVAEGNAYIVDGFLVLVAVFLPWYSKGRVLQEWLVLKLSEGGDINEVPYALERIAKERDCSLIITADSSPVSIMARTYLGNGFAPLTKSFYRRVP